MPAPALIDIGAAAEYLGVSVATMRDRVALRQIAFVKGPGRNGAIRFSIRDLDRWIEEHTVEAVKR